MNKKIHARFIKMSNDEVIYRFLKVNYILKQYDKSKPDINFEKVLKEGNIFYLWHELKNIEYLNKINKKLAEQQDKVVQIV